MNGVGSIGRGFQWGKGSGKTGHDELKEAAGSPQVLEAMLAQVLHLDAVGKALLHQRARRLREQDLPAVASAHDTRGVVDIQPHIALGGALRFAGMQPNAHSHYCGLGPGVSGKGALDVHRGAHRIGSAGKDHEKGIALRVPLLPMPLPEGRPQYVPALFQESSIVFAQLLQQARGPFHIGEEQGEGSRRQLRHNWPPRLAPCGASS